MNVRAFFVRHHETKIDEMKVPGKLSVTQKSKAVLSRKLNQNRN